MISSIPNGWRIKKLGNDFVSKIIMGQSPVSSSYNSNKDGLPFYQGKKDFGKKYPVANEYCNKPKKIALKNDILFCVRAPVGITNLATEECCIGRGLSAIRVNTSNCSTGFIRYFFIKNEQKIADRGRGSTFVSINKKDLEELLIPIPPLLQQEKIVKVLDISSVLIEEQKELIEKYDLFLKSKFIEMFGDPNSNPMGWEIEKLKSSILDVKNGLTRRSNDTTGEIVLKLKDIRENYIRFENLNRIQLDEKEKEKFIAKNNDLLFIRVNGNPDYVGRCSVFHGYTEAVYFNDHIMRIKVNKEKYNSIFLGYIVNSPYGKKQILKYRKTSAGQHTISQDGLERLSFYLPPIELQNKFASIVEKIETIKEQENKKLEHLETLHNSLMDKAFKGEIQ